MPELDGPGRLLPGTSAKARARTMAIARIAGFGLVILGGAVAVIGHAARFDATPFVIPVVAIGAITGVVLQFVSLAGNPREAAEVQAGYSTVEGHPNLDLVDPETGAVIRPAGSVGALDSGPRFEPSRRRWVWVVAPLVVFIVILGIAVVRSQGDTQRVAKSVFGFAALLGVGLLLALLILLTLAGVAARKVAKVAALRPDGFVFASTRTTDGEDSLHALGVPSATRLPATHFVVTFVKDALEIWLADNPHAPSIRIPWSAVTSVGAGTSSVSYSGQTTTMPALIVSVVNGTSVLTLPLPVFAPARPVGWSLKAGNRALDAAQTYLAASRR